ncbi:MAG: preprotein translocase subunit YajC [Candidatus Hydrogenedentes bacterium]|nr:preprotein translocase subunit YajC [Candidatus Hydrogenedentota bacterium]
MGSAFPIIMLVAIFYFLMIRPNQKQEKKRRDMLASLAKGDKVVTSGGICGTVVGLSEKNVVLRVSDEPAVKMEFVRGAVSKVLSREDESKS